MSHRIRPEFMSYVFDYVPTRHSDGSVDYSVWHGGAAPLNATTGKPAGHYAGRILKEDGYFYATPDDGSHAWDDLRFTGCFTSRHDAAVWLAGYRESTIRRSRDVTARCACGIPNRASWHTHALIGRPHDSGHGTETDYTDIYTCDEHFPGYPDGSMSDTELRSLFRFDGAGQWEVIEHHSTHLR